MKQIENEGIRKTLHEINSSINGPGTGEPRGKIECNRKENGTPKKNFKVSAEPRETTQ